MTHANRRSWLLRMLALLSVLALVAAACGSSDDDDAAETETDDDQQAAEADDTSGGGSSESDDDMDDEPAEESGGGASQAEIEEATGAADLDDNITEAQACADADCVFDLAAQRRAQVVAEIYEMIEAGEWGVGDDNILRGPGGFVIDLGECPADWDERGGITSSEIRLGQTGPKSGTLAAYGAAFDGWQTYLDYVNEQGGVAGLDVSLTSYDDAYVAAQTIEFVDELLENDNVFAIHTLGSPNTLGVYDKLNDECVPQPFVWTGHPAWGDPVEHPWTTGIILSYSTEAVLWGDWIKENLADDLPVVVGGLVMDNDFGLAYEVGFENYAHANPDVVEEFVAVRHDPAAPTITNEMSTIKAADPDVYISMTAGNACLLAIQELDTSGLKEDVAAAFTPSVCKAVGAYVSPAGDSADGWYVVGGGIKDTTDAAVADEPFVQFVNERIAAAGYDVENSFYGSGYMLAYPYIEALRVAAELPGGLTRPNFMLAVRVIDIYHPLVLDGIAFAMDGNNDAFPIEGTDYSQYDAQTEGWNIASVLDVNGKSDLCTWGEGGCQ